MILAVLLDLDDTLITTHTDVFFPAYLRALAEYAAAYAEGGTYLDILMPEFQATLEEYRPTASLYERLLERLADAAGKPLEEMRTFFAEFYRSRYPSLRDLGYIEPRGETTGLLDWLRANHYQVVVATNPGLPRAAIDHRMKWGGLDPGDDQFALITAAEEMHFGKPSPEYYAEIVLRLGVKPCEAIMVGDDWENDIRGAAAAGLNTFWVTPDCAIPCDPSVPLDGYGTYGQFVERVEAGWLDTLEWFGSDCGALTYRLAAFPAAIDAVLRGYPERVLECNPGEREWSARDILCHLGDHDPVDRERLSRILAEENPFLSANRDPWENHDTYCDIETQEALSAFVEQRTELVEWLRSLPDNVWDRPARDAIFGPTTFSEMVRFIAEHDRTHLRQMREAIEAGMAACS